MPKLLIPFLAFLFLTFTVQAQFSVSFEVVEPCLGLPTGMITANPEGGASPYTYKWNTGDTTQTISELAAGTYTATVTDDTGAEVSGTVVVENDNLTAQLQADVCGDSLTITTIVLEGEGPYWFDWSTGDSTQTITVTESGTYCVTLVDNNKCAILECITINAQPLDVTVETQEITCPGDTDASLTADVTGGTPPYSFLWGNGETTQTIENLGPGDYDVTVTDANSCTAETTGTVLDQEPIVIEVISDGLDCEGEADGSISTTVTGGTPPYSYLWMTGEMTPNLTGLTEGVYSLVVTDDNGCEAMIEVDLKPESRLKLNTTVKRELCPDANDGRAEAIASMGQEPYSYRWSTGETTAIIDGLAPDTYTVTVTDDLGCTAEASVIVEAAPDFTIEVNGEDLTSCLESNGAVEATVITGVEPITYKWSNDATTARVENLTAGTYDVTVTNGDGCEAFGSVTISDPPAISVAVQTDGKVCPGEATGTATAVVTGGTEPFTFAWSVDSTTQSISNLPAGSYTVTVTDAMDCSATATATIEESEVINIAIEATEIVCGPGNTGNATVSITGGVEPYKIKWSTGDEDESIENLETGTYSVTVEDANACEAIGEVSIEVIDNLSVSIVPRNVLCFGENTGSALANASGGSEPYSYAWSNGDSEAEADSLTAGTYTVTVTDGNGCQISENVSISEPLELEARPDATDATCAGATDGSVSVLGAGGTMPYFYKWSTGDETDTVTGLGAGTYDFTLTDANMCSVEGSVSVGEPVELTIQLAGEDITCPGGDDGEARVAISGGTSPYVIKWSNDATTENLTGLTAGTYGVTVTDDKNCETSGSITLNEPDAIQLTVEVLQDVCEGELTGAAQATATGGNGGFIYAWSNGDTGAELTGVGAGDYTVTATDSEGCTAEMTISIAGFENPQCEITVISDVTDVNNPDGVAEVSVTGGKEPYTYLWSDGQTTPRAENLGAGSISVLVTDDNGCTTTCEVTIKAMAGLGDYVWEDLNRDGIQDDNEPAVEGVKVKLKDAGGNVIDSTNTDANGKYAFVGLEAGAYSVMFVLPNGFEYTSLNGGGDDAKDSDANPDMDGMTATVTLSEGEFNPTLDAGIVLTPQFFIENACNCLDNATTEDNGQFMETVSIVSYPGETWTLVAQENIYKENSPEPPAAPLAEDLGVTMTEVGSGQYQFTFRTVDNLAFTAVFSNGTEEVRIQNVCSYPTVNADLPTTDLCVLDEVFGLSANPSIPGTVVFMLNGQVVTVIDPAALGTGAFDLTITFVPDDSEECTVTLVEQIRIHDDCFAEVGDFVWIDVNRDGIQDPGEQGIPGIQVIINSVSENDPEYTDTTFTDVNGKYLFKVPPGTYKITFVKSSDLIHTTLNAGSDDAKDSDADPDMGMTEIFILEEGEVDLTWDAGFYSPCENIEDPGEVGYDQWVCGPGGDPDEIISLREASGGSGEIEYLWMKSNQEGPFNPGFWEPIPDSNSPTYDPGPVYETTYFARCARREDCITFLETNIVVVEVGNEAEAEIIGPEIVCKGETATFSSGQHGEDAEIRWEVERIFPISSAEGPEMTFTFGSAGLYYITLYVTENDCTSSQRVKVVVTTSPSICGSGFVINASANESQDVISVNWQMRPDLIESAFTVQYSEDGVNFESIAQISQPSSSETGMDYFQFEHPAPKKGRSYYRVRMVDGLGNMVYSDIADVILYTDSKLLMAYPNPVQDELNLELFDTLNDKVTIDVFNMNGTRVNSIEVADETPRETLDFSSMPPGVYFVRVRYGEADLKLIRVVKQH